MGRSPMLLPSDLFSRDTFPGTADSSARDRKSTRLNSSHDQISYAVFCLKKKKYTNGCDRQPGTGKGRGTAEGDPLPGDLFSVRPGMIAYALTGRVRSGRGTPVSNTRPSRHYRARSLRTRVDARKRGGIGWNKRLNGPVDQLGQVPGSVGQCRIEDDPVALNALNFLRIPKREGDVVACRDEHAVGLARLEQIR